MKAVEAVVVRIMVNGHIAMQQLMFAGDEMRLEVDALGVSGEGDS